MAVKHLGAAYDFPPANRQSNYGDDWNIYVKWAQHMTIPCPSAYRVPPDMPLGEFLETQFRPDYLQHPDGPKLDFRKVEWTYEGRPWHPDLGKSLRENGLEHMSYLSFRSPGLEGMHGVGN